MIVMQVLEQIKRRMRINSVQCVLDLERYAIGGGISARKEVTDSIRKESTNCSAAVSSFLLQAGNRDMRIQK